MSTNAFNIFIQIFNSFSRIYLYNSANGLTCRSISHCRFITSTIHCWSDWVSSYFVFARAESKYFCKIVHILDILPCLHRVVTQNGESGRIGKQYRTFPGVNLILAHICADTIAGLYTSICSLQLFASRLSPVSSSHNGTVIWRPYRCSRDLIATGEKQKHI